MSTRSVLLLLVVAPSIVFAAPRGKKKPKVEPAAPVVDAPPPAPTPTPTGPAQHKPWADGVPEPVQKEASALYEEGNGLFGQQAHAPALEKYRAAVAMWDHPLIQFNLAVTLIRLDRILEAAEHLDKALRYGATPYKEELYQQALDYQRLVQGRVGYVEASCDQPGASVQLDGKQWFNCPGTQKQRVLAGEHTLVGEQRDFLTKSHRIVVAGGATSSESIKLVPLDSALILVYPYRRWVPWTITAAGAAIALGGAGIWFAGKSQMTEFDDNFARECSLTGCEKDLSEHPALLAQRDGAALKGKIGIGMMIGGGTVAVAGTVLAIMNRPKRTLPNVEVAPTGDGMKASIGWRW